MDATDAASRNRLLAALEPEDLRRLAPHLERVDLARGTVLLEPGAELRHVWWPEDCVVSLVIPTREGGAAEAATIGREGMVGFFAILGDHRALARNVVQVPGRALRLPFGVLREAFAASPPVRQVCLRYVAALLAHVLQSPAGCCCSRTESTATRGCRSPRSSWPRCWGCSAPRSRRPRGRCSGLA
jgi:CRP-like cAMP-binding protein